MSSGVINSNGESIKLNDDESFSFTNIDTYASYGISNAFEAVLGFRMRRVNTSYLFNNEALTTSITEAESFVVGAKYRFLQSKNMNVTGLASLRSSLYENNNYSNFSNVPGDEVALGDQGNTIDFAIAGDYKLSKSFDLQSSLGYRIVGNDLSEEIPYRLEALVKSDSLIFIAGANGVISLSSDEYEANPNAKPVQGRAPSSSFNSFNRSFNRLGGGIYYDAKSFRVGGRFDHIISGQGTDAGSELSLGLTFIPGADKKRKSNRNDSFQNYDIEAEVVKVSSKANFFRIDKGLADGVVKGLRFDIYRTDMRSLNELVAEAVVYKVSSSAAILKLTNRYLRKRVRYGFVARARL